ncbi:hypothetical protein TNCV_2648851 [Trichonephila clavipes]|nr:hypothetical protein TNCV_2648851 [Trichonephila clavipes]
MATTRLPMVATFGAKHFRFNMSPLAPEEIEVQGQSDKHQTNKLFTRSNKSTPGGTVGLGVYLKTVRNKRAFSLGGAFTSFHHSWHLQDWIHSSAGVTIFLFTSRASYYNMLFEVEANGLFGLDFIYFQTCSKLF